MRLATLATALWLLLCGVHAAADGSDWNQRRGNAAGTATSTVEPMRRPRRLPAAGARAHRGQALQVLSCRVEERER